MKMHGVLAATLSWFLVTSAARANAKVIGGHH